MSGGMRFLLFNLYILMKILRTGALPEIFFNYHNHTIIEEKLHKLQLLYPNICHVYSIGESSNGQELWVIAIGRNPSSHVLFRPNVKFVASIHGNEVSPKEVLLHYAEHLLKNYGKDTEITLLLNRTLIHILPLLNPDGLREATEGNCEGEGRLNANGEDLNRNFPDIFHSHYQPPRQQETKAIIKWLRDYRFVLSASLHNGALLVNVPYDNYPGSHEDYSLYAPTPDNDVFLELAYAYSFNNSRIFRQEESCEQWFHDGSLVNGVVNGADWYASNGTMQDYNYIYGNCMEITLEIGCCKYPTATELETVWNENRDALLQFTRKVHMGVRGQIRSENGTVLTGVSVMVDHRMPVEVSKYGEYWKLLLPGNYTLAVIRGKEVVWEQLFIVRREKVTELNVTVYASFSKRPANLSSLPEFYFERKFNFVKVRNGSAATQQISSSSSWKTSRRNGTACILALMSLFLSLRS